MGLVWSEGLEEDGWVEVVEVGGGKSGSGEVLKGMISAIVELELCDVVCWCRVG